MLTTHFNRLFCVSLLLFTSTLLASGSTDNPPDFSIAQIPDTQGFMGKAANCTDPSQVIDMYEWIFADNKNNKNYQYIFHVGDIIGNPSHIPSHLQQGPKVAYKDIEKSDQGVWSPQRPEDNTQWAQAKAVFSVLAKTTIPYGFATGNHDYLWPQGADGYSDYTNLRGNVITEVYNFLTGVYANPANGNVFIDDPLYTQGSLKAQYPSGQFYLIAYHTFNVTSKTGKTIPFVALNLPYGLTGSPSGMKAVNDLIQGTNALFILNVHAIAAIPYQPGGFTDLILKNKKIFMVLYGHDPASVYQNGTFETIPGTTISRGNTPAYTYRFDYQDRPNYTCVMNNSGSNMPQHPLLRTYEFFIDSPNPGDLSWKVYDVQAWSAANPIYNKNNNPFWTWATPPTAPSVQQNNIPSSTYTIQYVNYLN